MKKILAWGDSPLATTGMGKVNHDILKILVATGNYEVTVVGIHYFGGNYNRNIYPYNMVVANQDGRNLLGRDTFLNELSSDKWDIVFTHQDLLNINPIADLVSEARRDLGFKWIAYSPIDTDQLQLSDIRCVGMADFAATYSEFGKKVVDNLSREVGNNLHSMWLGTDLSTFYPATDDEKKQLRKDIFGITNDDTFMVLNVNANRLRKDLPRTILAFKKFSDKYSNSVLYIHAPKMDYGGDLERVAQVTGLDNSKIIYNPKLNPVFGVDETKMRDIYCSTDAVISTSLAEGWGLSCTEAFACGIPTLFPKHTSLVEIIGKKAERGYFIDMAGNRVMDWNMGSYWFPLCDEKSGADMLEYIYNNRHKALDKAKLASDWVKEHTWNSIGSKWVEIFDHIGDVNES